MSKETEATMIEKLRGLHHVNQEKYVLSNAYCFDWESDLFVVRKSGLCFEYEIKISRSDFFADLKKIDRHKVLSTGKRGDSVRMRPNRFYYAVTDGLITADEVPTYAGLIYVSHANLQFIKEAPLLHKEKYDFSKILVTKFYARMITLRRELRLLQHDYDSLLEKYNNHYQKTIYF